MRLWRRLVRLIGEKAGQKGSLSFTEVGNVKAATGNFESRNEIQSRPGT